MLPTQLQVRIMNPNRLRWLAKLGLSPWDIASNWGVGQTNVRIAFKKYKIKQHKYGIKKIYELLSL
jgi:hypothetical protein